MFPVVIKLQNIMAPIYDQYQFSGTNSIKTAAIFEIINDA